MIYNSTESTTNDATESTTKGAESLDLVVNCDCFCQMVHISDDYDDYPKDQHFYFSFYFYGGQKNGILDRIKGAFQYLIKGKRLTNGLVLKKEDAKKLAEHINKRIK